MVVANTWQLRDSEQIITGNEALLGQSSICSWR